jgi:ketosteroid isomerase-like protein
MNTTEANKAIVLAFADAYTRGDWDAIEALCTDDFRWVVPASTRMQSAQLRAQPHVLTGANRSRSEMLEIFKYTRQHSVDGRFSLKINVMTAEEDRVAAEAEGYATSIETGRVYENNYMYLMYFTERKIRLFREYQDTLHAFDVWMAS